MARKLSRNQRRIKRHSRSRNLVRGTAQRPRLSVFRSSRHMHAQLVDDDQSKTLVAASTLNLNGETVSYGGNIEASGKVGQLIAERALEKGIQTVVFDRGGYIYHGRVKALAEAARGAGLKF